MDGKPLDELITELQEIDPADAADPADEVAALLAARLELSDSESSDT